MRNKITKLFVVMTALLCSLPQHALGQRRDYFVDLYSVKKRILLPNEYDIFKCKQISDYLVSSYLCETKNDCLINLSTGYEFSYYAIGKIDFKSYWLLLYGQTDGYTLNIYLASYSKKDNRIIAKLRISEDVTGEKVMWYKINPDKTISIYRKYDIDGEVVVKKETYRINSAFSRVDKVLSKEIRKPLIRQSDIVDKLTSKQVACEEDRIS